MPHRPTPTKQDPKDTLERGRAMELLLLAGHWACGHEEWQAGRCCCGWGLLQGLRALCSARLFSGINLIAPATITTLTMTESDV